MITFLAESFWGIATIGGVLVLIFGIGLLQSGKYPWLYAALTTSVLVAFFLLYEVRTVTVREEIRDTLEQIATDLKSNDIPKILGHIAASAPQLASHARKLLPRVRIHRASVKSNLVVTHDAGAIPAQATAHFNAVFVLSETKSGLENQWSPWLFDVEFVREGDAWKVVRYERHDPRGASFDRDSRP